MKKSVVVIPTYNSKKNVGKLLREILQFVPWAKIIVVDDNSPDGTANEIKKHFAKDKRVTLIVREKKRGRGSAVIEGFKEGLKDKATELFIEMDSDFAHKPSDLARLIKKADEFDVVVATRYLLKSQLLKWKFKRRVISRLANLWIKSILGIALTDNTNGFRCYKRQIIEGIDFNSIKSKGFIVLTEFSYQIHKKRVIFGEVPIDFIPVDLNKSNLNIKEIKEAFFTVLRLKINSFF